MEDLIRRARTLLDYGLSEFEAHDVLAEDWKEKL